MIDPQSLFLSNFVLAYLTKIKLKPFELIAVFKRGSKESIKLAKRSTCHSRMRMTSM